MKDNVISFETLKPLEPKEILDKTKDFVQIIKELDSWYEKVKSQNLQGFAVVALDSNNRIHSHWDDIKDSYGLIGAIECLKHSILRDTPFDPDHEDY